MNLATSKFMPGHLPSAVSRWIAGESINYNDVEFRIVQPNGAIRWIHERGVLSLDERGKPYRVSIAC